MNTAPPVTARIEWHLTVQPVDGATDRAVAVARSWDLLATGIRCVLPWNLTVDEARTVSDAVWLKLIIGGRPYLRIPLGMMPSGHGPGVAMWGMGLVATAFGTGWERTGTGLLVRVQDVIELELGYDLRWALTQWALMNRDLNEDAPAPVALTRPLAVRVVLYGHARPPSTPERTD